MKKLILAGLIFCSVSAFGRTALIDPSKPEPFNILGVHLTKDDFQKVVKTLGPASLIQPGGQDADEHESPKVCYIGSDQTQVTFSANYAYGEKLVAEYLLEAPGARIDPHCAPSSKVKGDLKVPVGLSIGQTEAAVQSLLGVPKSKEKQKWFYQFERRKKKDYYTLDLTLGFDSKGLINSISVSSQAEPAEL